MITTNAIDQTTDTQAAEDAIATLEAVALDEVNGGWLYSPYAVAGAYNPYVMANRCAAANPWAAANPYAVARYEAHLAHRAAWMQSRLGWW